MTKKAPKTKNEIADFVCYVNVEYTAQEIAELEDNETALMPETLDLLEQLPRLGYKVDLSLSKDGDTYRACAYGLYRGCINAGVKVSSEAPTYVQALNGLMLKVHKLDLNRQWANSSSSARSKFR